MTGLGWMRSGDGCAGLAQTSCSGERLCGTRHAVPEGKTSMMRKVRLKSVQKLCPPSTVSLCSAIEPGAAGTFPRGKKKGVTERRQSLIYRPFLSVRMTFQSLGGVCS